MMSKYINQLLILARIRNLQMIVSQKLDDMPISYDVEKDHLYQRGFSVGFKIGFEQGYRKSMTIAILSLKNDNHSIDEIAKLLDLTQDKITEFLKNSPSKKN